MEAGLYSIAKKLSDAGILTDTALLFVLIGIIWLLYKHIFKPMFSRVIEQPTSEEVKEIISNTVDESKYDFSELEKRMDKILERIERINTKLNSQDHELETLKRDVELIKQILNQFQGHMMYGGSTNTARRSSDFGNKELT